MVVSQFAASNADIATTGTGNSKSAGQPSTSTAADGALPTSVPSPALDGGGVADGDDDAPASAPSAPSAGTAVVGNRAAGGGRGGEHSLADKTCAPASLVWYGWLALWMLLGLFIVCEEHFVPSLELVGNMLGLSDGAQGTYDLYG